jgi:hypothetical protein
MSLRKVRKGLDEFRYATKIVTIDIFSWSFPRTRVEEAIILLSKGQYLFFALGDIAFHGYVVSPSLNSIQSDSFFSPGQEAHLTHLCSISISAVVFNNNS